MIVLTRVVGPRTLTVYRDMLEAMHGDPTCAEFDALPPDADEATRDDLAQRLLPQTLHLQQAHPAARDQHDAPRGAGLAAIARNAARQGLAPEAIKPDQLRAHLAHNHKRRSRTCVDTVIAIIPMGVQAADLPARLERIQL